MQFFRFTSALCLILFIVFGCGRHVNQRVDLGLPEFVAEVSADDMGPHRPSVSVENAGEGSFRVLFQIDLDDSLRLDDWRVVIRPAFKPTFHWAPHLSPTPDHIIAQHVFRAPAMIVSDSSRYLAIVPDLNLVGHPGQPAWYMDIDAPANVLSIGVSRSVVKEHVLFRRSSGQIIPPGKFQLAFYVFTSRDKATLEDPWRRPLAFMYEKWFRPLSQTGQPVPGNLEPFVQYAYRWAFDTWRSQVWQEFVVNGKRVGAPVFIVNVTQSPNYPGPINEREFRSVWNQAWFSSLRSASGLYRYARRVNNAEWMAKARMTKELALAFPQRNGLFYSVAGTEMEKVRDQNREVARSSGWGTLYFGNSNRNPVKTWKSAREAPFHLLDMSWTAYLMLKWHTELEPDPRLVAYAKRYGDRLLLLQDSSGFFPGWLDVETEKPLDYLNRSPESSMSVTFLLKLYQVTEDVRYLDASKRAMHAVMDNVIPVSQWEDFETYWSCSRVLDSLVGQKIVRNNAFKQNTLSMFWTSEALINMYEATGDKLYLRTGQRVLDELLMYQATWQPPFIPIRALGGFGVMNADGEWNDSRQCLFAELMIRYGRELQLPEYVDRGVAALKSSFVMMYCPENPETREQWEKVYPFFNEKDYGFMMENYGHEGETNEEGLGIGEFTIYDWGNGAAAEAYNRLRDYYGESIFSSAAP